MAQNQSYAQYPYYAQPQNIYQQLGKPQPQPHLQSVYQQQSQQQQQQQQLVHIPQQQFQYSYQHPQQQPQQQPQIQRAPSAHGYQPPQTPFPNASGYAPPQQQQQQQLYQYSQPAPVPTPVPQAPAMYQRTTSQTSHVPTSSFANIPPGQQLPNAIARQLGQNQQAVNPVNHSTGQLVPVSQSLTFRGPSPAVSPGPPIAPSAVFAQHAQQQHQHFQQPPQPQQMHQQNYQQAPSMSLVTANRTSAIVPPPKQIMPPSQAQASPQPQTQMQPQTSYQTQNQPPPLPPRQAQQPQPQPQTRDQQRQIQPQPQGGQIAPPKPTTARRPLPTPGAPRTLPSANTTSSALISSTSPSAPSVSPAWRNIGQQPSLTTTTAQPSSPTKTTPTSPTKALPSPNQANRPLPTPGGGSSLISGAGGGSGGNGHAREGFAGIGTKSTSSRVTGLPIDPSVSSLVAGIEPHKLMILPLPDGSSPTQGEEGTPTKKPVQMGLPNPPSLIQTTPSTPTEGSGSVDKRRAASPPRFQPGSSTSAGTSSRTSSPTKDSSPSTSSGHKPSPIPSTAPGQSSPHAPQTPDGSPTKKSAPTWKRTIPDYPQPAFGYAAGIVKDPWAKSPTSTSVPSGPQKQSTGQTKPVATSAPSQALVKPTQADLDRQRAFVERQHVERQLNTAMAQAYAQAKAQQQTNGMPVSNTSYSAYAMYSRSNPNLHQSSSRHVRSGAYGYEDDDEDGEEDDDDDDDDDDEDESTSEEEMEETEEEREIRKKKHGKKPSETTVGRKTKKKKGVTKGKGKGKEDKDRKAVKKSKPTARSTSAPPKKRIARQEIPSTSEDDTELTELTQEETEEEEDLRRRSRHTKSSSTSSSRFRAKVEKEKEMLKKKRPQSQYDYPSKEYHDDEDIPRQLDWQSSRRTGPGPSQRQSYHRRDVFRQNSPSPPPNTRVARRVSPPRMTLLKDAQRKTIKLRGGDDEDEFDDRGRHRNEEVERWKHGDRYRSQERVHAQEYAERERRYPENHPSSLHYDHRDDQSHQHEHIRQREREIRYSHARGNSWHSTPDDVDGPPQPPTMARRRDTAEPREDQVPRGGRRNEREQGSKIFSLSRQGSPNRHPVRDSVFATGYRGRPTSPTRAYAPQQTQSSDVLMSPYHSQPTSPTRPMANERGGGELMMKFSAMDVNGREKAGLDGGQGKWPVNLPRLPRTPGETSSAAGGYFDGPVDQDDYSNSRTRASADFASTRERASGGNGRDTAYSSSTRPVRRDAHNPRHHQNLDMNLDDPPPRSVSPALSQGSASYDLPNQTQQQSHSFVNRQPKNDVYSAMPNNQSMQRPKSLYGNAGSSQQPQIPLRSRPQSQVYNRQVDVPQPSPSPPRPRSINPYEREELNKTKINNGTPKVQTINIESPAPVGGREKRANLDKMMSDPEDDDYRRPIPRIDINNGLDGDNQRVDTPSSQGSMVQVNPSRGPIIQVNEPREGPAIQVDSPRGPAIQIDSPRGPTMQIDSPRGPMIQVDSPRGPVINIEPSPQNTSVPRNVQVFEVPGISVAGPEFDDGHDIQEPTHPKPHQRQAQQAQARPRPAGTRGGLICGGCDGPIIGRIVSAMGSRWHPQCFKCTVCNGLLEHVSSYEHNGRPYCHLDYHENFAPRCFSCKTAIIEERFISLDDPALGKRTYHEQHFFCAECGDPFLAPSMNNSSRTGELSVQGDGEFESDDVGFTVYKGHPYCEACHVRLRLPKCKRCKKSIRDHEEAVEALGGKWCWGCFVCAGCEKPFENPSFFQRGDKPFCERCFDIMLRNEV